MNTDDDRMCAALRAVADEPAPPATTTLDHVLTKGRRRVFVQRSATVAAVVGVVATIGIGGVLLRSAAEGQGTRPAGPPASTTTTVVTTTPPPSAETSVPTTGTEPPSVGPGEPVLLPGWHRVEVPADRVDGDRCLGGDAGGIEPDLDLPPQQPVTKTFLEAVRKEAGEPTVTGTEWAVPSAENEQRLHAFIRVDVHNGAGSLHLEIDRYGGSPDAAADADVGSYGTCAPPARTTLADGTVLQLDQPDRGTPDTPMQFLRVYQPNGRLYIVTVVGRGYTETSGRVTLPLDDSGIADVGTALAALGR
jgi:hypothetical protein